MCGICGFLSFENASDCSQFYSSARLISHRGPDDEGYAALTGNFLENFRGDDTVRDLKHLRHISELNSASAIFGHRRLSIIDLSVNGHQPFISEDNRYLLLFNGELFNYLELKKNLEETGTVFRTSSDTEVFMQALIHWGIKAFSRFNGMWAAAFYDLKEKSLLLSRDRFGIKPLFYSVRNNQICFASEMKFILAFSESEFSINRESVELFLDYNLINSGNETLWNEICELQPGTCLCFSDSTSTIRKWWTFVPETSDWSLSEASIRFSEIFEDSLRLRMRSDVEVGTLLSGGLDSTSIVCSLEKLGFIRNGNFQSFSAVFEENRFSERPYIESTLQKVPLKGHFIFPDPDDVEKHLDKLLYHTEQPLRSLSVLSQFLIYRYIKSHTGVKVLLNGQGGDELFGGYSYHYYFLFAHLAKKLRLKSLFREISLFSKNRGQTFSSILNMTVRNLAKMILRNQNFNDLTFSELSVTALREYLTYDDRTSMAFGLEARVPFLDYRLVEFAFSLPVDLKIRNFTNKFIVRNYAKGLIPDSVLIRIDKQGFESPQEIWQKNALKPWLDNIFKSISSEGIFDFMEHKSFNEAYRLYQSGDDTLWDYIWRIACLYQWKKLWFRLTGKNS